MTPEISEQDQQILKPYLSDPQVLQVGPSLMEYNRFPMWDNKANGFLLKNEEKGGNTFLEFKSRFQDWAGKVFCVAWGESSELQICIFPFYFGYDIADSGSFQASLNLGHTNGSEIQIQLPKEPLPLNILDNPNVLNLIPDSIQRIQSIRSKSSTLLLPGQIVNPWEVFLDRNRYRISSFAFHTISENLEIA